MPKRRTRGAGTADTPLRAGGGGLGGQEQAAGGGQVAEAQRVGGQAGEGVGAGSGGVEAVGVELGWVAVLGTGLAGGGRRSAQCHRVEPAGGRVRAELPAVGPERAGRQCRPQRFGVHDQGA
jgi:hypothetical protein